MALFGELKRRGVLRVGAAYLAIAWLLLQVLDVLGGIVDVSPVVAEFTLYALLIGFPAALLLSWLYDLTPEGVMSAAAVGQSTPPRQSAGRKTNLLIISALSLAVVLLVVDNYIIGSGVADDPDRPPVVGDYVQLTQEPIHFPPTGSQFPILVGASRLVFPDWSEGGVALQQMAIAGGDAVPMASPFEEGYLYNGLDLAPDDSSLLLLSFRPEVREPPGLWEWPALGGEARRLGSGISAIYSSDGAEIYYVDIDGGVFVAKPDLSEARKIGVAPPGLHWPSESPDGESLTFHTYDSRGSSIWEMSLEDGAVEAMIPGWERVDHCCGSWTPDGEYFVFQAKNEHREQIWALQEGAGVFGGRGDPVPITSGALAFIRPSLAKNGKDLFAIGWQLRGEIVRYDAEAGLAVPLPGFESLSAEWMSTSRDGEWVVYVSYPEAALWRSRSDGSDALRLTGDEMRVFDPKWSPDGETIAFSGQAGDATWNIYTVSRDGGDFRPIADYRNAIWSPTWSPDGKSIAFNKSREERVQLLELATGAESELRGTKGLLDPSWSPDGRFIAGLSDGSIVLFDLASETMDVLAADIPVDGVYWSADSRFLYYYEEFWRGPERSVYKIDVAAKESELVAAVGSVRPTWGVLNIWVGIAPDGSPLLLRDVSIHHIYALDWRSDRSE